MRIAYLTTDEVNQNLATRMAEECGIALDVVSPKDKPLDGRFDAAIYDLDGWPAVLRDAVPAKLFVEPSAFPVAVHSYNLRQDQIESLCQSGVSVYRRLDRVMFVSLLVAWRLRCLPDRQPDEYAHRNGRQESGTPVERALNLRP